MTLQWWSNLNTNSTNSSVNQSSWQLDSSCQEKSKSSS
jgi:hypothetical protein